jgi:hypothetical protein
MSRLYDYNKKQWVNVPEGETSRLVAEGTHGFESGIKIPVVSPDGKSGFIPSENANKAFKSGYRFGTQADFSQAAEVSKQESIRQHYDNDMATIAEGVIRGASFGLSDVAVQAFGSPDMVEQVAFRKNESPILSTASEIGGMLLNPLTRKASTKIFEKVAGATAKKVAPGLAAKGADLLGKVAGGAAEGSFFGVAEGISEAALGNPDTVAEVLLTVGEKSLLGGMFGGAAGGIFGVGGLAADAVRSKTAGIVGKAAQNELGKEAAVSAIKKLPNFDPETKELLNDIAGEYAEHPSIVKEYLTNGKSGAVVKAKELRDLDNALKKEMKNLDNQVNYFLKRIPKEEAKMVEQTMKEAGQDLYRANADLFANADRSYKEYWAGLAENMDEPKIVDRLKNDTNGLINKLVSQAEEGGVPNLKEFADKLRDHFNAFLPDGEVVTEGSEMLAANSLRQFIDQATSSPGRKIGKVYLSEVAPKPIHNILLQYRDKLDGMMKNHPNADIAAAQQLVDDRYAAFSKFNGFVKDNLMKAPKDQRLIPKDADPEDYLKLSKKKSIRNLLDPEKSETLNAIISNVSKFADSADNLKRIGRDINEKKLHSEDIKQKIDGILNDTALDRRDLADVEDLLRDINADGDMLSKVGRLQRFEKELAELSEIQSPITKYVRLKQVLGQDVGEELQDLARMTTGFQHLEKLEAMSPKDFKLGSLANAIPGVRKIPGIGSTDAGVGTVVGGLVGGPAGAAAGLAADTVRAHRDPMRQLKTIAGIHSAVNKGVVQTDKVISRVAKSLTSPIRGGGSVVSTVRKATAISGAKSGDRKKKRERVKTIAKNVSAMVADPAQLVQKAEAYIAPFDDTPGVQQAITNKAMNIAGYLNENMPDSLRPEVGNVFSKNYEPSSRDVRDFERIIDAAFNPMRVLDRIEAGSANMEDIQALSSIYPEMYQKLQEAVINDISKLDTKIPYAKRVMLGNLLDIQSDPSMAPQFIADMQQKYQKDQGGRPEGSLDARPRRGKLDSNPEQTLMTQAGMVENRGVANP